MIPFGVHTHGRHFDRKVKYVFDFSTQDRLKQQKLKNIIQYMKNILSKICTH